MKDHKVRKKVKKKFGNEVIKEFRGKIVANQTKLFAPAINVKYDNIITNSCFDIIKHTDNSQIDNNTDIEFDITEKKKDELIKCFKVDMQPSNYQKTIIQRWFGAIILMYNETINYIIFTYFFSTGYFFNIRGVIFN